MKTCSRIAAHSFAAALCFLLSANVFISAVARDGNQAEQDAGQGDACVQYKGAWFEICHPGDFKVIPSLASSTAEGYDSARFVSPDRNVSFYVYAPQWGGQATDIAIDPEREVIVADQVSPMPNGHIRWFTIAARDGSYRRSYRETIEQQGSIRTILGIKYSDADALKRYAPSYERFRKSLRQFAD